MAARREWRTACRGDPCLGRALWACGGAHRPGANTLHPLAEGTVLGFPRSQGSSAGGTSYTGAMVLVQVPTSMPLTRFQAHVQGEAPPGA